MIPASPKHRKEETMFGYGVVVVGPPANDTVPVQLDVPVVQEPDVPAAEVAPPDQAEQPAEDYAQPEEAEQPPQEESDSLAEDMAAFVQSNVLGKKSVDSVVAAYEQSDAAARRMAERIAQRRAQLDQPIFRFSKGDGVMLRQEHRAMFEGRKAGCMGPLRRWKFTARIDLLRMFICNGWGTYSLHQHSAAFCVRARLDRQAGALTWEYE
jgi:hypothetical protein